jgi:hypothetical protein
MYVAQRPFYIFSVPVTWEWNLWHYISAQKGLDFGAFHIFGLWILHLYQKVFQNIDFTILTETTFDIPCLQLYKL